MVLISFYLFLTAFISWISATSLSAANNLNKRMCFKCNMPHDCSTGFCYGDYCVKSISGNHYVSKGCENKSTSYLSVYARSVAERSENVGATNVGCVETELFGIPNTVCYCNDSDYCNGSSNLLQLKSGYNNSILQFISVIYVIQRFFLI